MRSGILIAVEGIDGAGKTTQVNSLVECLQRAGEDVISSKEPTDGQWGRKLRASAATGRLPLDEELKLFILDRREHVESLISPALEAGKVVILDRYFYSTIAYQGARGADASETLGTMLSFAPVPDVVLLLDAPPEITLHRISHGRNELPNEFEKRESLEACRSTFLNLATFRPEIQVIDATRSTDDMFATIIDVLLKGVFKKRCAKHYECDVFNCSFRNTNSCEWAKLVDTVSSCRS